MRCRPAQASTVATRPRAREPLLQPRRRAPAGPVRGVQHRARRRSTESDPAIAAEPYGHFAANIWPDVAGRAAPGARRVLRRRPGASPTRCSRCSPPRSDLPAGYFAPFATHSTDTMRVNHYETAPGDPDPLDGAGRHGRPHRLRHRHGALRRPGARPADRRARRAVARRGAGAGRVPGQPRRPDRAVDERPLALDAAPGAAAGPAARPLERPAVGGVLPRRQLGRADRVPADVHGRVDTRRSTRRSPPAST